MPAPDHERPVYSRFEVVVGGNSWGNSEATPVLRSLLEAGRIWGKGRNGTVASMLSLRSLGQYTI
jgi:hypothetical protein